MLHRTCTSSLLIEAIVQSCWGWSSLAIPLLVATSLPRPSLTCMGYSIDDGSSLRPLRCFVGQLLGAGSMAALGSKLRCQLAALLEGAIRVALPEVSLASHEHGSLQLGTYTIVLGPTACVTVVSMFALSSKLLGHLGAFSEGAVGIASGLTLIVPTRQLWSSQAVVLATLSVRKRTYQSALPRRGRHSGCRR